MEYVRKLRMLKLQKKKELQVENELTSKDTGMELQSSSTSSRFVFEWDTQDVLRFKCSDFVENIFYIPEFLTPRQERQLLELVETDGSNGAWVQLKTRRLQCYGDNISIPLWLQQLLDALVACKAWMPELAPNHVLVNEYQPGEGIMHHTDGPLYLDNVIIISLDSAALMTFRPKLSADDIGVLEVKDTASALLMPRSLLCFQRRVYDSYLHGILEQNTDRVGDGSTLLNIGYLNTEDWVGDHVSPIHILPLVESNKHTSSQEIARGRRLSLTIRHKIGR